MRKAHKKRQKTPRIQKKHPPGSAPGTIGKSDSSKVKIEVYSYNKDSYEVHKYHSFDDLVMGIKPGYNHWINVADLQNEKLIGQIGKHFKLHNLSLEDVIHTQQRSKAEQYDENLYVVMRVTPVLSELNTQQLSLFVGEKFVITFQETSKDCLYPIRERLKHGNRIKASSAGYLAYAIIDTVVDTYFPILESFADHLDYIEESLLSSSEEIPISKIHEIKSELMLLRRVIWSHREMVYSIVREEPKQLDSDTMVYVRDCYDHTLQQLDLVETYRDVGSGLMDLSFSTSNKKSADIMKVLTIVASIFIPLTFIAGVYGMNFNVQTSPWNMPELNWYFGYPIALGSMFTVAAGLLIYFKIKKWF